MCPTHEPQLDDNVLKPQPILVMDSYGSCNPTQLIAYWDVLKMMNNKTRPSSHPSRYTNGNWMGLQPSAVTTLQGAPRTSGGARGFAAGAGFGVGPQPCREKLRQIRPRLTNISRKPTAMLSVKRRTKAPWLSGVYKLWVNPRKELTLVNLWIVWDEQS